MSFANNQKSVPNIFMTTLYRPILAAVNTISGASVEFGPHQHRNYPVISALLPR